jgi:GxxExxY protein
MEIHRTLGRGFSEVVYKDALEYELGKNNIRFEREKLYEVKYKEIILPRKYVADFVVMEKFILEVKSCTMLLNEHVAQILNYLAISKLKLGLLINFGEGSLKVERVIL